MTFILNFNEKYNILETLSENDKCVVLNAESKANGEHIIIRVMYNAVTGILKSLPQIKSPYITQVIDVIQDGKDVIVIEKFIEGITIQKILNDGETLTESEIYSIFSQLCCALIAIHDQNIIHRDIKPANIMIHDKTAVLIDFDVARQYNSNQSSDTVYMGTKGYAAPEQYGFSQTDRRSDIYSLGVVIKELLGNNYESSVFRDVIDKCMQFDPINRYQSANEISSDLKTSITGHTPVKSHLSTNSKFWHIKRALKIIGYALMGLYCIVVLLRQPHEITITDYILSKIVYLELVIFLFVPFLNIFRIRSWFPLMNHKKLQFKILGFFLYIAVYVILVAITSSFLSMFYSEQAKAMLAS